jgi:hypothetical protein
LNLKKKSGLKKKFEKEKEKKENHSLLTFRPKRPSGPSNHHAPARLSLSLFFFSFFSLTPGPHLSAPPFPLPFLLPPARWPPPQPRGSRRAPAFSPSLFSPASSPIKAINRPLQSRRFPFSPCLLYARTVRRPSMASPPAAPSPSASPSSLRPYLSSRSSSCASLCTCSTPTHANRAPIPQRRRLGSPPPPCKRRRR